MAGLGRKVWTRETLSSADLQGYVQDQTVMRYASSAARAAAIPVPTEGMVTYLDDVNRLDVHDGAAWQPFAYAAPQYERGAGAFTTGAGGVVTVSHSLGVTPTTVVAACGPSPIQHLAKIAVSAKGSTQIQFVVYNSTNGTGIASNPVDIEWTAYR